MNAKQWYQRRVAITAGDLKELKLTMQRNSYLFLLFLFSDLSDAEPRRSAPDKYHKINSENSNVQQQTVSNGFPQPFSNVDWNALGKAYIQNAVKSINDIQNKRAKNVIMFLGDGMGLSTVAASRIYNSQLNGLKGEDIYMSWEKFPFCGLSRTYNVDRVTPDSAGTATAYLCGVKANLGTIGVNENVARYNCSAVEGNRVRSIAAYSNLMDKWSGIVTTARVTHASPAGAYAHVGDRDWEAYVSGSVANGDQCSDIAKQLVTDPDNQNIRVILGGGYQNFIPNNETDPIFGKGSRKDGVNLIDEWKTTRVNTTSDKIKFVQDKTQFDSVDPSKTDYLMGLFNRSYMDFEVDRQSDGQPSISDMTRKAIQILSRNQNGYFLFVEGGKIDIAHHDTIAYKALNDTLAMSEAVQLAYDMTDPSETLIVVTADHSHTFTLGGYGAFSENIFGFADLGEPANDGKPYLQLSYLNGPGYVANRMDNQADVPRKNLTYEDNLDVPDFEQDAGIWLDSETHGGEDVAVYATGPMAHLFHSTCEQSYIAHVMMYASCVGAYAQEEHCTVGGAAAVYAEIQFIFVTLLVLAINGDAFTV